MILIQHTLEEDHPHAIAHLSLRARPHSKITVIEVIRGGVSGSIHGSLAEIQVVVKRAVLGGSEMFGISVASLYKVIMDYVKGEGHLNQKKIEEMRRSATDRAVKASASSPMIQAYSGQFIRNHKNR